MQARDFKTQTKIKLLQRGLTVTKLAKELNLARNTVSLAINHESLFPNVKKRIERRLAA